MGLTDDYLTLPKAAKMLGVSRQYLGRLAKAGRIKVEKVGRYYAVRREKVEKFLTQK